MFVTNIENESFGSKNTLAILLVILFPYCMYMLSKKMSVYNFSIVILFIIAIFYTFSRSALILLLLSFPLLLMSRDRKLIKASFITVLIITFISLSFQISPSKYNELKLETKKQIENNSSLDINSINSFSTESARFDYISKSVYGFVEKPVFGHGFSSFRRNHAYFDDKGEHIRNPVTHNDYAQVLYEMGILGIVSFLYLFFFNLKRLLRSFNRDQVRNTIIFSQIILLGVALNAINLLDHAIFWVIMALTLTRKTNNKHSQSTIIET